MKTYALLEYIFMFDPGEIWSHAYEFEHSLTQFLKTKGLEAQIVKTVEGAEGRRVLLIQKSQEEMIQIPKEPVGRPKGLKRRISDVKDQKLTVSTSKVKFD